MSESVCLARAGSRGCPPVLQVQVGCPGLLGPRGRLGRRALWQAHGCHLVFITKYRRGVKECIVNQKQPD
jgi:hypothetical protein